MDTIDTLLENNRSFAEGRPDQHLDVEPQRHLAIVTCMDSRLDVFAALGLGNGEVMLIHHTDCGMQKITDDGFRAELQESTGTAPSFAIESFGDVEADVRQSILRVRRSPFLLHRDLVRGFVYDVDSHRLREVETDE
jgi:carbonic anhydrase